LDGTLEEAGFVEPQKLVLLKAEGHVITAMAVVSI
jgi:hypothetical protein